MTPSLQYGRPGPRGRTTDPAARLDAPTTLELLTDDDCRSILRAVGEDAKTAAEIGAACGVAQSTCYRKLETLVEAGMLEERVRLDRGGKHASEYGLAFDGVDLRVTREGSFEVDASDGAADRESPPAAMQLSYSD